MGIPETRASLLLCMMREPNRPFWLAGHGTRGADAHYDGEWFNFSRTPSVGSKTLERLAQFSEVEFIGDPRWGRCRLRAPLHDYDENFGDLWIE